MWCEVERWQRCCRREVLQPVGVHSQCGRFIDTAGKMGRTVAAVIGVVALAIGVGVWFSCLPLENHDVMPCQWLGMDVPSQCCACADVGQ